MQSFKVPTYLVFNGYRPLWCLPHWGIFESSLGDDAIKVYEDWAKRRGVNKPIKYRQKQSLYYKAHDIEPLTIEGYDLDRFNIKDGHHRACIHTVKGIAAIELSGTHGQERLWREREERVNELLKEIQGIKRRIYQPIDTLTSHETERSSYDRLRAIATAIFPPSTYQIAPKSESYRKSLDVLDVGCNYGFFSNWLSRMGHKVVGIDGSPKLEYAAKLAKAYGLPTQFHRTIFQDYNGPAVDLVLDLSVCWHLMWSHKTMTEKEFVGKIKELCKVALISEVKSTHVDKYIKLITSKTHLSTVRILDEVPYFQDRGGRKILLFTEGDIGAIGIK